jgi:uncharacterized protein (TIGR00266 family)
MKCEVLGDTAFPLVRVQLERGEAVKAESGAMVAMSTNLKLTGKADGGLGKAITRMFTGESFFMQNIEAENGPGWVLLASATPGETTAVEIREGQDLRVQKGGFLACTPGVEVGMKTQGIGKGLFSGEGFFIVNISGKGTVFLSTYGSIYPLELKDGETVHVDNGHLVAWDASMRYEIVKGASGWLSSATSGEGLGCRFEGPGRLYIQTRNPVSLGAWLFPFLPLQRAAG